jgi:hypothetical protein
LQRLFLLPWLFALVLPAQELPSLEKVLGWDSRRDIWQKPAAVLAVLNAKPGSSIADIGAGLGYFPDAALVALTWHLMDRPAAMLRGIHAALKPGRRLVISAPMVSKATLIVSG